MATSKNNPLLDTLKRPLRDLRISVTDRCNFRCVYCMPKHIFGPDHAFLKKDKLLTFEEIERVSRSFADHGVKKLRITGGEPLIRANLESLIEKLSNIPGIEDISLTTNGSLLTLKKAQLLKAAGLNRITISLDSIDSDIFKAINGVGYCSSSVLQAIENATTAGLSPVKVNMVVKKGVNDQTLMKSIEYFRNTPNILRFIEYMDVGNSNGWVMDEVVTAAEIRDMVSAHYPIEPVSPDYHGEVAERWRYVDGSGEIGIITSVSQPFCQSCSRARLSAEGSLFTCLFASEGHDLRELLRNGSSDQDISDALRNIWQDRGDRYSELRSIIPVSKPRVEMSYIGG